MVDQVFDRTAYASIFGFTLSEKRTVSENNEKMRVVSSTRPCKKKQLMGSRILSWALSYLQIGIILNKAGP